MTVPRKGKIAFGYAVLKERQPPEAEALIVTIDDPSISAPKIATAFTKSVSQFHKTFRVSPRAINHLRQELGEYGVPARDYFERTSKDGNVA